MPLPESTTSPTVYTCDRHGDYAATTPDGYGRQSTCPPCEAEANAAEDAWRSAWGTRLRFERADIPVRYRNRTLGNWTATTPAQRTVLTAARQWFDAGDPDLSGLVLCGPPGTGKTHLAIALMIEQIRAGRTALYVSVPDLLTALRGSYARASTTKPEDVLQPLDRAGVLVMDEIAATRGTDWERETLAALIDARYRDGRGLIICTNAAPPELHAWIGERAADRLQEFALVLALSWPSHRGRAMADSALRDAPVAIPEPPARLDIPVTYYGQSSMRKLRRDVRDAA